MFAAGVQQAPGLAMPNYPGPPADLRGGEKFSGVSYIV